MKWPSLVGMRVAAIAFNAPVSSAVVEVKGRNVIGTSDGTLKGYGIEIIARDVVVTDT